MSFATITLEGSYFSVGPTEPTSLALMRSLVFNIICSSLTSTCLLGRRKVNVVMALIDLTFEMYEDVPQELHVMFLFSQLWFRLQQLFLEMTGRSIRHSLQSAWYLQTA